MAQVSSSEHTGLSGSKRYRSGSSETYESLELVPAHKKRKDNNHNSLSQHRLIPSSSALTTNSNSIPYEKYILNNILNLINDESINDVTFIVEGEELYGIRSLFACQSAVFRNMLYGNMMESNPSNEVILNDITINAFKYLRNTFYNIFTKDNNHKINDNEYEQETNDNHSKLTPSIVVDVLFAAQKYLIQPLIAKCIEFIKSIQDINDWYSILTQFEKSQFQYQSKLYLTEIINVLDAPYILQYKSHKFLENDRFKSLKSDTIIILINSDNLAAKEHQIWDALIKWSRFNANSGHSPLQKQAEPQYEIERKERERDDHKDEEDQDEEEEDDETEIDSVNKNKDKKEVLTESEKNLLTPFIKYIRFNQMDAIYLKEEIVDLNILPSSDIINIMFARENGTKWKSSFNDKERIASKLMDTFVLNEICLTLKQIQALKIGDLIDFRDLYGLFCPASIIDIDHSSNRIKIHYNNWGSTYDEWYEYLSSSAQDNQDEVSPHQDEDENNENNENNEASPQQTTESIILTQQDRNYRIARYGSVTNRKIKREMLSSQIEQFQANTNDHNSTTTSTVNEIQVKLPMWFWKKNENYIDNKHLFTNKWLNAKIVGFKTAAKYSHHIKIGIYVNEDHYEYWIHPDNNDECRPLQK